MSDVFSLHCGRKRAQTSAEFNHVELEGQRKITLAFHLIKKAPQGHHGPATAMHGRMRWPVYTSMHGVTFAVTRLLLLCNVYAQRESLGPLRDARSINPAYLLL